MWAQPRQHQLVEDARFEAHSEDAVRRTPTASQLAMLIAAGIGSGQTVLAVVCTQQPPAAALSNMHRPADSLIATGLAWQLRGAPDLPHHWQWPAEDFPAPSQQQSGQPSAVTSSFCTSLSLHCNLACLLLGVGHHWEAPPLTLKPSTSQHLVSGTLKFAQHPHLPAQPEDRLRQPVSALQRWVC